MDTSKLSKETRLSILRAVEKTIPQFGEDFVPMLLRFCRRIKGIPDLSELPVGDLRFVVKQWCKKAEGNIQQYPDEIWEVFCRAWPRVRQPFPETLVEAVKKTEQADKFPPEAKDYHAPKTKFLVSVCYYLQKFYKDKPFPLACRTAGEILGIPPIEASRKLHMLVVDGVLKVEKPWRVVGQRKHEPVRYATEYRYVKQRIRKRKK